MDTIARDNSKTIDGISDEAMAALCAYDWPGNIRELRNCIERMVVLCREPVLQIEGLPVNIREKVTPGISRKILAPATCDLERNERALIARALNESTGNRTKAAEKLGISRRTLHRKLNIYNIE